MTPRAIDEKTTDKRTDEPFDFPETSDMCDFGYALVVPEAVQPTPAQSSK